MSNQTRPIQEPGEWPRRDYNEERKGNDMVDPRPAQPSEPPSPGQPAPPVVVQDLPEVIASVTEKPAHVTFQEHNFFGAKIALAHDI